MTRADQIRFAAHAWDYALNLCLRTLLDGPEREALLACEERPDPSQHPGSAGDRPGSSLAATD